MAGVKPTREKVALALTLAGSFALRCALFPFVSGDMRGDMIPWSEVIARDGAWKALGQEFSNYPPLYLYLLTLATWLPLPRLYAIKFVYVVFDYVLAAYVGALARECDPQRRLWPGLLATLFLPTVVLNSSLWGQCDAMYASGLAACVYYLLRQRALAALTAYGLAWSLKPQALFLAPVIFVWTWQRRFSPLLLYVVPAVYVALAVPVWLAGRPWLDVLLLYPRQPILPFPALTLGATNPYQWLPGVPFAPGFRIGLAVASAAALAFMVGLGRTLRKTEPGPILVRAALVSLVLMPYLLPAMHERYFFAADALAVAYAFWVRRGWVVAALIQVASSLTYLPYLFEWEPVPRAWLALVMGAALVMAGKELLDRGAENPGVSVAGEPV